jgi:hypothetical protein
MGFLEQETIQKVLHQCVPQACAVRPYQWEFMLVNGKPFSATARVENEWMIFEAPYLKSHDHWQLLQLNARLGPTTRFVIGSHASRATLRSEVLLHEGTDLLARLRSVTDNLTKGMGLLHEGVRHETSGPVSSPHAESIRKLCEESGWNCQERDGEIVVPLEVPEGLHQARVEHDSQGRLHLSTMCEPVAVTGECNPGREQSNDLWSRAVAQFLLRVTSKLRMVRAETVGETANFKLRFTCLLNDRVHVSELNEAFANLSMACEFAASEVVALGNLGFAERYLQMQNGVHHKG